MSLYRVSFIARRLNIGRAEIIKILSKYGYELYDHPNCKINKKQVDVLLQELATDLELKKEVSSQRSLFVIKNKAKFQEIKDDVDKLFSNEMLLEPSLDICKKIIEGICSGESRIIFDYGNYLNSIHKYIDNTKRFLKRLLKGGFKAKRRFYNFKDLILSILSPSLYYTFSGDEEEDRAASNIMLLYPS